MKNRISKTQVVAAVAATTNMRQMLIHLGITPWGRNYAHYRNVLARESITTPHWRREITKSTRAHVKVPPKDKYTRNSRYILSPRDKRWLVQTGVLSYYCAVCSINTWQGLPLVLQLDHINGVKRDNRFCNLRLLCANCHSQTDTFCGRNKYKPPSCCPKCAVEITSSARHCQSCARKGRAAPHLHRTVWPTVATLKKLLATRTMRAVAAALGVSDTAVRRHLLRKGFRVQKVCKDGKKGFYVLYPAK